MTSDDIYRMKVCCVLLVLVFITCSHAVGMYDFSDCPSRELCANVPFSGSYRYLGERITNYNVIADGHLTLGASCGNPPFLDAFYEAVDFVNGYYFAFLSYPSFC